MTTIGSNRGVGAGVLGTLPDLLRIRSEKQPDATAYVFLSDGETPVESLTYRELYEAALGRAAALAENGLSGRNAVLAFPSGLEFIRTLLGCMYAGVTAAPVQVPRRADAVRRLRRIVDDAGATTVLTTGPVKHALEEQFGHLPELTGTSLVDGAELTGPAGEPAEWPMPQDIALLQYTSGSTGDPKGAVITHANFLSNAAETDALWPCEPDGRVVSWLPMFHDMGMLFGVVLPLWAGVPSVLMAPDSFIRRPARWLEAIARFRATHSAAPNFAYELCVRAAVEGRMTGVGDLSSWRVAANGAEPVRWQTIREFVRTFAGNGFDPRAMCPGYGLAENTLKATGSRPERPTRPLWVSPEALGEGRVEVVPESSAATPLVSSGVTVPGTVVRVVDPRTRRPSPPDQVGEVWISGPCVAMGYWGRPQDSEKTFRATAHGVPGTFLRTGDLGFTHDGELYITGRLKDVIIRRGRNFYPQDIELTVESVAPNLHPNCTAAFSVDDGMTERLVVVVEVDGRALRATPSPELVERITTAIWDSHRLTVDDILVVRRGALSKTSSGKVQRRACRTRYLNGDFVPVARNAPQAQVVTLP
ncbi:fatty acyl-AMP ligase [Micromonospora eburnea]|uniref:Acyl-CoA synthetase (AMP-forming)/AMP-acid ligase II n=1 Tax=Micromonospora eburnea TaxID=227316 RepID=A0A1C6UIY7_9ACTN|nr:fatty acyl-AMP ligase [Micromonospora eburnea]SCL54020.1 Acyl-CoA synthetase (AMP-forming)/AMP-acid ligase II [Micromonospora eburnea]